MSPVSIRRFARRMVRSGNADPDRSGKWGPTRQTSAERMTAGIATSQLPPRPMVAMITPMKNGPIGSPKFPALM